MFKKKLLAIISALCMLSSVFTACAQKEPAPQETPGQEPASSTEAVSVKLFHTNDAHSRYDMVVDKDTGKLKCLGYAGLKAIIDANSTPEENVLILEAGDVMHGQPFATINKGESITQLMKAIGYDAMAAGNHDFNYGYSRTVELAKAAEVELLGANVLDKDGKVAEGFVPYHVYTFGETKVGVFGLATPETAYKTNPKNVENIVFADPVETAKKMVDVLTNEEKVDAIVGLVHLGIDESSGKNQSTTVAENVEGIDLIIDGHSHSDFGEYSKVKDTVMTSTGCYLSAVGMARITINGDDVAVETSVFKAEDYTEETLTPAQDIVDIIATIQEGQSSVLNKVISNTSVILQGEREDVRTKETNLSRLITTAMLQVTGADCALTNGGGIRASIDAGEITIGEIETVLPFGNYIVTIPVTGEELKSAVEHGLPNIVDGKLEVIGNCAHVAGMEVVFNPAAEKGSKITSITIGGQPLDPAKEYTLATNDFLAVGGDDYTMLSKPVINEYMALDEAVIEFLNNAEDGTLEKLEADARITIAQ